MRIFPPKAGQRVLRSHRTYDQEKEKDKERTSPQTGPETRGSGHLNTNKSPQPSGSVSCLLDCLNQSHRYPIKGFIIGVTHIVLLHEAKGNKIKVA